MIGFHASRCEKPDCKTGSYELHRHHRASEKFFLDILHGRYRDQRWYQEMVSNYYAFRKKDVVTICAAHHAEIHHKYTTLVGKYIRTQGPPQNWTKQQAENLMALLKAACLEWMRKPSPGIKGEFKELQRMRRATQNKKKK